MARCFGPTLRVAIASRVAACLKYDMLSFFKDSSRQSPALQSVQAQIASVGFALLKGALPRASVEAIREAAQAFYLVAERNDHPPFPRSYLYNPGNMATGMAALDDYGTANYFLLRTIANSPASECLRHYLGDDVLCSLTHSRLRKSYPQKSGQPRPSTVAWHTDGGPDVGYYQACILWVPFTPCNDDYTGLELQGRDGVVHRPTLEVGDALFFDDKLLHRTADCPSATQTRYSCDVRFFRASDIPSRVHQKIGQEPLLVVRAFAENPW
jgi:hypothetical protein